MRGPAAPRLHPRLTAARPDLAASHLRGIVEAARYSQGQPRRVMTEVLDLKRHPRPDASVDTQLLLGDTLVVYEEEEGWAWVQADRDDYVGYVASSALGAMGAAATHRAIVNRTFIYPAPDMKQPIAAVVPLDGRVIVGDTHGEFATISGLGFAIASHLAPLDQPPADFVTVAAQLRGAPYLWGGKSVGGIDCSGLVQLAMAVTNRAMPRDTDMQESVGHAVPIDATLSGLRRGDLVFWKGHVGMMIDPDTLLHANGHHMLVMQEPLRAAQRRIETMTGLSISSIRRSENEA